MARRGQKDPKSLCFYNLNFLLGGGGGGGLTGTVEVANWRKGVKGSGMCGWAQELKYSYGWSGCQEKSDKWGTDFSQNLKLHPHVLAWNCLKYQDSAGSS